MGLTTAVCQGSERLNENALLSLPWKEEEVFWCQFRVTLSSVKS